MRPFTRAGYLLAFAMSLCSTAPSFAQAYRPGGAVTDTNPQPVKLRCWSGTAYVDCTLSGGGGGGGTGDASATNQTTQITAANLTNTRIGDIASPATGSTNARLALITTTLGAPFQVGGTIGNTAFAISGALPAYAATPTFNLGTLNGAATAANQATNTSAITATQATAGSSAATASGIQGVTGGLAIDTVVKSAATDRGASIGTTATQLMAANSARRGFSLQVQSATASCYINGSTGATIDFHSLQIASNAYFETASTHVGTGAISIVCTAAATSVYAREW